MNADGITIEAALAEAKAGWDSCIADLRAAAEICRQAEERERKLLASLADPATVHTNILRGTIALTKAQAIHIAGLPADIEGRERVLREALTGILALFTEEPLMHLRPNDPAYLMTNGDSDRVDDAFIAADAALATPAPEPVKQCAMCKGTGAVATSNGSRICSCSEGWDNNDEG